MVVCVDVYKRQPFDEFSCLDQIKKLLKTEHTVVCAISEGIRGKNGDYIGMETKSGAVDTFGHTYLSGVGKYLEMLVSEKIGCKVRSIESVSYTHLDVYKRQLL